MPPPEPAGFGDERASQEAVLDAVQGHPVPAAMAIWPDPPAGPKLWAAGTRVKMQARPGTVHAPTKTRPVLVPFEASACAVMRTVPLTCGAKEMLSVTVTAFPEEPMELPSEYTVQDPLERLAPATGTRDLPDGQGGTIPAAVIQAACLAGLADTLARVVRNAEAIQD